MKKEKYGFTGETIRVRHVGENGDVSIKNLNQIVAKEDFTTADGQRIVAGMVGGYIESEKNLSQYGNCWVGENAKAYDNAVIKENALLTGNAICCERATLSGNCIVKDNAIIKGSAQIEDNAKVMGDALVKGNATVKQNATICDSATIDGFACITQDARVGGTCIVTDGAKIGGNVILQKDEIINGNTELTNNTSEKDNETRKETHKEHENDSSNKEKIIDKGLFINPSLKKILDDGAEKSKTNHLFPNEKEIEDAKKRTEKKMKDLELKEKRMETKAPNTSVVHVLKNEHEVLGYIAVHNSKGQKIYTAHIKNDINKPDDKTKGTYKATPPEPADPRHKDEDEAKKTLLKAAGALLLMREVTNVVDQKTLSVNNGADMNSATQHESAQLKHPTYEAFENQATNAPTHELQASAPKHDFALSKSLDFGN